jgi:hypothetical protein
MRGGAVRAYGREISVAAIGGALALPLGALLFGIWHWRHTMADAINDAWAWLGRAGAVPHWLLLLLIGVAALGAAITARATQRARKKPTPVAAPPIVEAETFQAAYDTFLSSFAAWRDQLLVYQEGGQPDWLDEYRANRRAALDALQPIRAPLREWLARIDEHYTDPWPNEPTWVDADGPDEGPVSIIDKFLMPSTLTAALGFWNDWDVRDFRRLAAERMDLIDSFVRSLRRQPDPED